MVFGILGKKRFRGKSGPIADRSPFTIPEKYRLYNGDALALHAPVDHIYCRMDLPACSQVPRKK
jgi:hypothetical protein